MTTGINKDKLSAILNDLYAVDNGLRNYSAELEKIVSGLLAVKPNAEIDEVFKNHLLLKIREKIREIKSAKKANKLQFLAMPAPSSAFALVLMLVFLSVPAFYFLDINKNQPGANENYPLPLLQRPTITKETASGTPAPQLANPASANCADQGGSSENRRAITGETGFCVFSDGSECDEWKLFRGECQKGEKLCKDLCGDGACQEIVCLATGCPCAETVETCPDDCP